MSPNEERQLIAKTQHRNTRHAAIEKIEAIRAKWSETHDFSSSDSMMNEITGAIMNLPFIPFEE